MWFWIIVTITAIVHSLVIDDNENQRIKNIKDEVLGKYTKMR